MAHFGDGGTNLGLRRAGTTPPSGRGHGDTSWACPRPAGVVAAAHLRPGALPRTFKTKQCIRRPSGAQKACTSSVGLPSPHKKPKETCPRLIFGLCDSISGLKNGLRARWEAVFGKSLQSAPPWRAPNREAVKARPIYTILHSD